MLARSKRVLLHALQTMAAALALRRALITIWTAAHAHGCSTPVLHFSEFDFSSATTIALPFCQRKPSALCVGALERIECSDELAEAALEQSTPAVRNGYC